MPSGKRTDFKPVRNIVRCRVELTLLDHDLEPALVVEHAECLIKLLRVKSSVFEVESVDYGKSFRRIFKNVDHSLRKALKTMSLNFALIVLEKSIENNPTRVQLLDLLSEVAFPASAHPHDRDLIGDAENP